MTTSHYDIAIIGAGIAGASVAAALAVHKSVVLLERETQPGYHSTGRSAAAFAPFYGPGPIRALTRASHTFFSQPPVGFTEQPLLKPLGAMFLARTDQLAQLEAMYRELAEVKSVRRITADELEKRVPLLRKGYAAAALTDNTTAEIEVAALHQGFLRSFRNARGRLHTSAEVQALHRRNESWQITTGRGVITAQTVVNAAGAWADDIGQLAGAEHIGLRPLRRTALIVEPPTGFKTKDLPLLIDIAEQFYLKPDAGKLLISPANEDLDVPCDVQPDELDIALCIDRIERAFDLSVQRIEARWAGLRSFVADKTPVAGYSTEADNFYWLAGQGGYGIQTSPALSRYAAAEILGQAMPQDVLNEGLDPAALSPNRDALS